MTEEEERRGNEAEKIEEIRESERERGESARGEIGEAEEGENRGVRKE